MRALLTGDWHGDWRTLGVPRFAEVEEAVRRSTDAAIERRVDAYVFGGDLCDPDSGVSVFRCVRMALAAARRLAEKGVRSVWIAGNHDVIEDGSGETTLSPLHALCGVAASNIGVFVYEQPGVFQLSGGGTILALPFTATSHAYDPAAYVATLPDRSIDLAVGHLHVPGVQPGEETKEMPRGREITFPVAEAKRAAKRLANCHYHRRQVTPDGIIIPGSLARLTRSEVENEPGFVIIDTEAT